MRVKKAIKILEDQKSKVFKVGFLPVIWVDETCNYIEQFFGKDSEQYRQINTLIFKDYYPKAAQKFIITEVGFPSLNEEDIAASYIDSFIRQLKNFGFPPRQNHKDKTQVHIEKGLFYSLAITIIGAVFYLGFYFGNYKFDKDKEEFYKASISYKNKYDSLFNQKRSEEISIDTSKMINNKDKDNYKPKITDQPSVKEMYLIKGIVKDNNQNLISLARISTGNDSTYTNANGYFEIRIIGLPIRLQISKKGYENEECTISDITFLQYFYIRKE